LYLQGLAGELVNVLREAGQVVPDALMKFGTHVKKKVCIQLEFFYLKLSYLLFKVHISPCLIVSA
jgi:hypothetical protein